MTNLAGPTGPASGGPWDAMTGWNSAMMSAVDCLQGCASAYAGWQQETARFVERRRAENQRIWAALQSASDPAAALRAQQEWVLRTANDYAAEATRVARLATTLALTGTTPEVQQSAALLA